MPFYQTGLFRGFTFLWYVYVFVKKRYMCILLKGVTINYSLWCLLVMSRQMIHSVGSQYILKGSTSAAPLKKIHTRRSLAFFKPICSRIEPAMPWCHDHKYILKLCWSLWRSTHLLISRRAWPFLKLKFTYYVLFCGQVNYFLIYRSHVLEFLSSVVSAWFSFLILAIIYVVHNFIISLFR